ncbi:N-terminal glutamine amidase-domain-containing protein [Phlebopus sp. FC_14]|nr:N-terminal glutamine amidase-domain-containing protein [Phlebopus sp. FC_14]
MSPTLPDCSNCVYTNCYCEENIFLLLKRFLTTPENRLHWDFFAVLISNPTKTVALWNQRAASSRDSAIIWDYHVVLALRERERPDKSLSYRQTSELAAWIYDLDTCLPVPCHWQEYVGGTFPPNCGLPVEFQSLFRVVPGEEYLNNFASDRSHMISLTQSPKPQYFAKAPPYPCICGPSAAEQGIKHNLMSHFVSMVADEGFGSVMDFSSFVAWCSRTQP